MDTGDVEESGSLIIAPSSGELYQGIPSSLLDDYDQVLRYQRASLAPATIRAYQSDFQQFVRYCDAKGVATVPAMPETVAAFLTYEKTQKNLHVSTLERRLAAIRFIHYTKKISSPTDHPIVARTIAGIRNTHGLAPIRQKDPLSMEHMMAMLEACPETPWGIRDAAILALGFSGAFRRSEISALLIPDLVYDSRGRLSCLVRQSKTDRAGRGQLKPILNGGQLRTVDRLERWLNISGVESEHVFRRLDHNGDATAHFLRPQWIARVVTGAAKRAGLDPSRLGGHSLRAGFVTEAAEHGEPLDAIMGVTLQRDARTVLRYIRRAELWKNHPGKKFL